jgi:hypothetical protein
VTIAGEESLRHLARSAIPSASMASRRAAFKRGSELSG